MTACVECMQDDRLEMTNCTYCGTDLCFDCLFQHEIDCPDNDGSKAEEVVL